MLRLFRYTGKINFPVIGDPTDAPAKLLFELKRVLVDEKASNIQRNNNTLCFEPGFLWLTSTWNVLASIGKGRVEVTVKQRKLVVTYQLSFFQLVLRCTGLTVFFAVVLLPIPKGIFPKGSFIVIIWLLFIGVNFALTLWRFPKLIVSAWKKAFHYE